MRPLSPTFLTASILLPALCGGALAPLEATPQRTGSMKVAERPFPGAPAGTESSSGPESLSQRVPFVGQTPLLCGGAAAAMVKRFWGETGVYAEDYQDLVRPAEGGIRITELSETLRNEGWEVYSFRGAAEAAGELVGRGIPVIALEGVDGGRFHYVVLVEWTKDSVGFHDPAIGPGLKEEQSRFLKGWKKAGYRFLVILPGADGEMVGRDSLTLEGADTADRTSRENGQRPFKRGADLVILARSLFDQERYPEAEALARRSLDGDPGNPASRRILAASLYLAGRHEEALSAWNPMGRPSVDIVEIQGLNTLPHPLALARLGTAPGDILTPDGLRLAERRLAIIPTVVRTRADYTPNPDGTVALQVYAMEASPFWKSWSRIAGLALEGLTRNQAGVRVPGLLKEGEALAIRGSWLGIQPSAELGFSTPSTPLPGVVSVRGSWGAEQYADPDLGSLQSRQATHGREEWTTLRVSLEDWLRPDLRGRVAFGLSDWKNRGSYWGLMGDAFSLSPGESIGARIGGEIWDGTGGAPAFSAFRVETRWRRRPDGDWPVRAELRAGVSLVSRNAPRSIWPGAGLGRVRPYLLRAHILYRDAGILKERLGRELWHAGAEVGIEGWRTGPFRFSPGVFLDAALSSGNSLEADVGASTRVILSGVPGWLEMSVGGGLTDGASAVTLAWRKSWWR